MVLVVFAYSYPFEFARGLRCRFCWCACTANSFIVPFQATAKRKVMGLRGVCAFAHKLERGFDRAGIQARLSSA